VAAEVLDDHLHLLLDVVGVQLDPLVELVRSLALIHFIVGADL